MKTKVYALGFIVILSLLLSACGSTNTAKSNDDKPEPISTSAIKQTVLDMKSRENVKDASFTVKGDKIKMKLVVDNISTSDSESARKYADQFLRAISMYVDDNQPTKDSYGKIYDGYYVDIVVEDPNGMQAIEGKMLPGYSISWE